MRLVWTLLLILVTSIATIITAMGCIVLRVGGPFNPTLKKLVGVWARSIYWSSGVELEVEGLENIDPTAAYVLAPNHQSLMDLPLLFGYLPLRMTAIGKKEVFWVPFLGWGAFAAGVLPVDRSNRKRALETVKKAEEMIRKNSLSLVIFPEGTRTRTGEVGPFKKGPFMIAMNTGLPVLPITIDGNFEMLPKKSMYIKPGKVKMTVHAPVSSADFSYEQIEDFKQKVWEKVTSKLPPPQLADVSSAASPASE